jgi:hypothetical protein
MAWWAQPSGQHGQQPVQINAADQSCLTIKVLFGRALQQPTAFVENWHSHLESNLLPE